MSSFPRVQKPHDLGISSAPRQRGHLVVVEAVELPASRLGGPPAPLLEEKRHSG